MTEKELQIWYIDGEPYYKDDELEEYRGVNYPGHKISFTEALIYLQENIMQITPYPTFPDDEMYVLMQWPQVQEYMDAPWFENEAHLSFEGSSNYFIPYHRIKEFHTELNKPTKTQKS